MIIAYVTPDGRLTWDPHGLDGWYIGYAPERYQGHRFYITKTRAERIARTVYPPYLYAMPKTSSADTTMEAELDLTTALQNPHPITPFANVGHAQLSALWQLAEIFSTTMTPSSALAPSPSPSKILHPPPSKDQPTTAPQPRVQPPTHRSFLCSGRERILPPTEESIGIRSPRVHQSPSRPPQRKHKLRGRDLNKLLVLYLTILKTIR